MTRKHGRTTRTPKKGVKKGSGYERPPLGPISSQLTRVKLLCLSYPDASEGVRIDPWSRRQPSPSPGSLGRNGELWPFGSYPRLEDQFEALRIHSQEVEAHRLWYRWFWRVYVQDAYGRREVRYPARVIAGAHAGLLLVASGMGDRVYVPMVVSEANSFHPDEALAFTRRILDQRSRDLELGYTAV